MTKQVTYTNVDGREWTFTANTKFTTQKLLGNSVAGVTTPERIAGFEAGATATVTKVKLTNGVESLMTLYYRDTTSYITDYGMQLWAIERLDATEFKNFTAQVTAWTSTVTNTNENPKLMYWWKRYTSDPNVKYQDN